MLRSAQISSDPTSTHTQLSSDLTRTRAPLSRSSRGSCFGKKHSCFFQKTAVPSSNPCGRAAVESDSSFICQLAPRRRMSFMIISARTNFRRSEITGFERIGGVLWQKSYPCPDSCPSVQTCRESVALAKPMSRFLSIDDRSCIVSSAESSLWHRHKPIKLDINNLSQ